MGLGTGYIIMKTQYFSTRFPLPTLLYKQYFFSSSNYLKSLKNKKLLFCKRFLFYYFITVQYTVSKISLQAFNQNVLILQRVWKKQYFYKQNEISIDGCNLIDARQVTLTEGESIKNQLSVKSGRWSFAVRYSVQRTVGTRTLHWFLLGYEYG